MARYQFLVEVQPQYLPEQSTPDEGLYVFAYTITITNTGDVAAQLISRTWNVNDANGHTEKVKGLGVIGQQPLLKPGQAFEYTSGTRLRTPTMAAPGPKRLSMTMLREIEAGPFGKLLTRGVEDNVPKTDMSKLLPGLIKMGDIFTANKVLYPGDVITLDWIPGTGMVVTAKGKVQGEPFKEPEFLKAMMSIWFGPVPADFKLKDARLGTK